MDKPFPAYDGTEPYFFVSYDHGDSETVYPEMSWIRTSGFNLWYDEGIHVGTVWRQALADALSRCAGFIFFSTAQSNHSDNCLKEINFALDEGKPVFVVQLDDSGLPPILRLSLSDRQALVKSAYDEASYRSRLQSALGSVVKPNPVRETSEVTVDRSRIKRDTPDVAVMPLTCASADPDLQELTEGLSEDMTAALSRSYNWTIPGRASDLDLEPEEVGRLRNVRYLLSGSVRRRGPDVRVTMKLVATADGQRIWSQWYDKPYEDFYKYQDSLIAATDSALLAEVFMAEGARLADRPIEELDGFTLLCRAWNEERNYRTANAVALAERAVAIDPEYGIAHAVLGIELSRMVVMMVSQDVERDSARGLEHADRALVLAPNEMMIASYACATHARLGNETLAMKLAERASNLGGKPHRYHYMALIASGRSEEVFKLAEDDSTPPQQYMGLAELLAGRWEEAVERFEIVVTADSRAWDVWAHLANALAMVDRLGEARDAVARVKSLRPDWTLDLWEECNRRSWRNREEIVEASTAGLRKLAM